MERSSCRTAPSTSGRVLAAQQGPRDDELGDLGRAVTDLEPDDVAQALAERAVAGVAEVPEGQQALVDDLGGELRGPELGHGGLGAVLEVLVLAPQRLVAHVPRAPHV